MTPLCKAAKNLELLIFALPSCTELQTNTVFGKTLMSYDCSKIITTIL